MIPAAALSAVICFSSLGTVYKFTGPVFLLAYAVLTPAAVGLVLRRLWRKGPASGERAAVAGSAAGLFLLAALFAWLYPLSNSGAFGGGSDRDEDIRASCQAVMAGDSPYGGGTYSGHAHLSMPGAIAAALPFYWLGNTAYQNFFWLGVLWLALRRQWRSARRGSLIFWTVLAASPELLRELFTGGTLLANALFVSAAAFFLSAAVDEGKKTRSWILAAAFGVLLSSRPNFLLIVPILTAYVWRRSGAKTAGRVAALTAAGFAVITLPAVLADPAHFPRPADFNIFTRLEPTVPATHLMAYLWPAASLLVAARTGGTRASFLWSAAGSQALPAAALFILWLATNGANAFAFTGYGLNALFLTVFACGESLRDRARG